MPFNWSDSLQRRSFFKAAGYFRRHSKSQPHVAFVTNIIWNSGIEHARGYTYTRLWAERIAWTYLLGELTSSTPPHQNKCIAVIKDFKCVRNMTKFYRKSTKTKSPKILLGYLTLCVIITPGSLYFFHVNGMGLSYSRPIGFLIRIHRPGDLKIFP